MTQEEQTKKYDLEERTLLFSKELISFLQSLPKNTVNFKLIDQCIRSGTSVGANYREANETETKKDFLFRMRICRKEAKETVYWLDLVLHANGDREEEVMRLRKEAGELLKICAAIVEKSR